jgi:hypothetical protein
MNVNILKKEIFNLKTKRSRTVAKVINKGQCELGRSRILFRDFYDAFAKNRNSSNADVTNFFMELRLAIEQTVKGLLQ